MIESFQNWISALFCIGIFISILELILPKSKTKKYIYVLVGIVTIITIISPAINLLNNDNIAKSVSSVVDNFSNNVNINNSVDLENYRENQETMIKDQFVSSLKTDIETKLTLRGVNVTDIHIIIAENYDIQKLRVKIKSLNKVSASGVNDVVDYINNEYGIDYSKIEVIESGD